MTGQSPTMEGTPPVVVPTEHGPFAVRAWTAREGEEPSGSRAGGVEHLSATAVTEDGRPLAPAGTAPLVRLHSECLTGDVFGSRRCDCGPQLHQALALLAREGGTLLYLRGHEGRGIGLANKLRAYALQDSGLDTVDANLALGLPADARRYDEAAGILRELGLTRLRLLSNNPAKAAALTEHGIGVLEMVPDEIPPVPENVHYLSTKRERMGHCLSALAHPQLAKPIRADEGETA